MKYGFQNLLANKDVRNMVSNSCVLCFTPSIIAFSLIHFSVPTKEK